MSKLKIGERPNLSGPPLGLEEVLLLLLVDGSRDAEAVLNQLPYPRSKGEAALAHLRKIMFVVDDEQPEPDHEGETDEALGFHPDHPPRELMTACPKLTSSLDPARVAGGVEEYYLLSRIDGFTTVENLKLLTRMTTPRLVLALLKHHRLGTISFEENLERGLLAALHKTLEQREEQDRPLSVSLAIRRLLADPVLAWSLSGIIPDLIQGGPDRGSLGNDECMVLALVSGKAPVAEICQASTESQEDTLDILFGLFRKGIVTLRNLPETMARSSEWDTPQPAPRPAPPVRPRFGRAGFGSSGERRLPQERPPTPPPLNRSPSPVEATPPATPETLVKPAEERGDVVEDLFHLSEGGEKQPLAAGLKLRYEVPLPSGVKERQASQSAAMLDSQVSRPSPLSPRRIPQSSRPVDSLRGSTSGGPVASGPLRGSPADNPGTASTPPRSAAIGVSKPQPPEKQPETLMAVSPLEAAPVPPTLRGEPLEPPRAPNAPAPDSTGASHPTSVVTGIPIPEAPETAPIGVETAPPVSEIRLREPGLATQVGIPLDELDVRDAPSPAPSSADRPVEPVDRTPSPAEAASPPMAPPARPDTLRSAILLSAEQAEPRAPTGRTETPVLPRPALNRRPSPPPVDRLARPDAMSSAPGPGLLRSPIITPPFDASETRIPTSVISSPPAPAPDLAATQFAPQSAPPSGPAQRSALPGQSAPTVAAGASGFPPIFLGGEPEPGWELRWGSQLPVCGDLAERPFSQLHSHIQQCGLTGLLHLRRGVSERAVYYLRGQPTFAVSNVAQEGLGSVLWRANLIPREAYLEMERQSQASSVTPWQALQNVLSLVPEELEHALGIQFQTIFGRLLTVNAGEYWFTGKRNLPPDIPVLHLELMAAASAPPPPAGYGQPFSSGLVGFGGAPHLAAAPPPAPYAAAMPFAQPLPASSVGLYGQPGVPLPAAGAFVPGGYAAPTPVPTGVPQTSSYPSTPVAPVPASGTGSGLHVLPPTAPVAAPPASGVSSSTTNRQPTGPHATGEGTESTGEILTPREKPTDLALFIRNRLDFFVSLPKTRSELVRKLKLGTREMRLVEGMEEGTHRIREIVAMSSLGRTKTEELLVALWSKGYIDFSEEQVARDEQADTLEVMRKYLVRIEKADHFEALDLHPSATANDVEKAFHRLTSRYDEKKFATASPEMQRCAKGLRNRFQKAYEVLKERDTRQQYRLKTYGELKVRMYADVQYKKGDNFLFWRNNPWESKPVFESAHDLMPSEGLYLALWGYATYRSDPTVKEAIKEGWSMVQEAIRMSPKSPHVYGVAARFEMDRTNLSAARDLVRKAQQRCTTPQMFNQIVAAYQIQDLVRGLAEGQ